jgi:hypothetical protein
LPPLVGGEIDNTVIPDRRCFAKCFAEGAAKGWHKQAERCEISDKSRD